MCIWFVSLKRNVDIILFTYRDIYASTIMGRRKKVEGDDDSAERLLREVERQIREDRIILSSIEGLPHVPIDTARGLIKGIIEPKKQAFILALAQLGNRTRAAKAIGISTMQTWNWRRDDDNFRAAYMKAMEVAGELMEDEMVRRACEGVIEPVFQGGKLVGSVRKYSDTLLIFGLKGAMPDKYADRQKIQHEVDIVGKLRAGRERALGRKKE